LKFDGQIQTLARVRWSKIDVLLSSITLAYRPPTSSTFLSEQTSRQQPTSSTFLSKQTSTNINHQPNEQAEYLEFIWR
jgi:hypothetical protein